MKRLLRFLVQNSLDGAVRETSEYAIGIEVFDRDTATYNTCDDPIVRVQVGRLREKLKTYYATSGSGSDIEITIPCGGYMPVIRRTTAARADFKSPAILLLQPLQCISQLNEAISFTQGLNEELTHQLFAAFGKILITPSLGAPGDTGKAGRMEKNNANHGINYRLEGSVRIDIERIRTSIRLIDVSAGRIVWSEQADRKAHLAIAQQEELALFICSTSKRFIVPY